MKNIYFLLIAVLFISCEEVVEVDLNTAPPRLVIEAPINWVKGTNGENQKIKLSTTTGFYSTEIPTVSGATVFIKNSSDVVFNFMEVPNTGEYICTDFQPVLNETYTLTVISNGATYTATETLNSVAPITEIIQNNEGGFTGDAIELKAYYNDPADETNYYLYEYAYSGQVISDYYVDDDEFFNGNPFFSISGSENLKAGDIVRISHYGISKSYYNYMAIVVSLAGLSGGGPFQSPPATIRGNIINATNADDFPLGYFSVCEADIKYYTIQ